MDGAQEGLAARENAACYLECLESLASEIAAAIQAIAANSLERLTESVSKQELLCASLSAMAVKQGPTGKLTSVASLSWSDPDMAAKIRSANQAIRALTLEYAALLKHSGKSIALLAALYRGYMGAFPHQSGSGIRRQTWSCEA